ncbi:MAG: DUF4278 domain-containing protein [Phormidesmis sp.]
MQLTYRGRRYQKRSAAMTTRTLEFPCVYRGTPYKVTYKPPNQQRQTQQVTLTYRGNSYAHALHY